MTKTVTLNLTLEELKTLDKYVELNDETRPLFDKIRNAYPKPTTLFDVIRNLGYSIDCSWEIVAAVEEFEKSKEPEKWDVVRESKKWCEEHPDESVEDYLKPQGPQGPVGPGPGPKGVIVGYEPTPQEPEDNEWTIEKLQEKNWYVDAKTNLKSHWEPKPHTPEKTEKLLREAFQKVQQTEEWKETQRKIDAPKESWMNKSDEELVAMLEKDPPDCLKFVMGKTLEQIIERWWCDTFTGPHEKWSMEECIDDLIDQIELFLPRSQSAEGTQSVYTEVAVEAHNELLQKIKSKLRNKK